MGCLNEDAQKKKKKKEKRKKKRHFLYIRGRDEQIATRAKLLNIKYKFYGFSGDLIETIN